MANVTVSTINLQSTSALSISRKGGFRPFRWYELHPPDGLLKLDDDRRRYSKGGGAIVNISRSSVYETIEEEAGGLWSGPNSMGSQYFAYQRRRRGCPYGVDDLPFPAPTSYEFGLTTKSGKVGVSVNIYNDKVDTDTAAFQHQETPAGATISLLGVGMTSPGVLHPGSITEG